MEDVEINPVNGDIYFTAKGVGRTYRFTDNGTTVSNFITFVGGQTYPINYGSGVITEDWGGGNDNLTFDDKGNLYVLQDGGKNHVWLVRPDHTQANPKIELFMTTPTGSEPTGMTFTPDYKYMFISIQEPNGKIAQKDVKGTAVTFDRSTTLVVARKESFKPTTIAAPLITGPATAKKGSNQNYSVIKNAGSSYNWNVVNGTQTSGGNTSAISVLWGSTNNGEVNVVESLNNQCTSTNTKLSVILETIDVKSITKNSEVNIYPNPAYDRLNIDFINASSGEVLIYDISGKLIKSLKLDSTANTITVTDLTAGVYSIKVSTEKSTSIFQIIKK